MGDQPCIWRELYAAKPVKKANTRLPIKYRVPLQANPFEPERLPDCMKPLTGIKVPTFIAVTAGIFIGHNV
jgi:hypothetical protein